MHLLDTYALNCGVKIDKPYIYTMFYPLGESKYITIQPFSNYSGKVYDYWNEVINYMQAELSKHDIKIVQIGKQGDPQLAHCIWTQGSTTVAQASFLIKNSMLHLGVDSFGAHIASAYGKKIVGLYSTNWAENCKPYWSNKEDYVLLEPDRNNRKPSFQFEDTPPKTINEIKPEEVAKSALSLLGINYKINHKTLFIGEQYSNYGVHVVPSSIPEGVEHFNHVAVRMDLDFNEDNLFNIAQKVEKISILTDKAIDLTLVEEIKDKIRDVVYILKEDNDINFVKYLHSSTLSYVLLTRIKGEELSELKFKYLDYDFIFPIKKHEDERRKILESPEKSLVFKTNRKILKDKNTYASVASLKNDKPLESITSHDMVEVIDNLDFWEDLQYFYIAKKID